MIAGHLTVVSATRWSGDSADLHDGCWFHLRLR